MKSPKPKPPASQPRRIWRLLERGEKIQKRDEVLAIWDGCIWKPVDDHAGFIVANGFYRRRILVCGYREIGKV